MFDKKKKFYITTSIAYTNAPPHIGFALESIQADVLARYRRSLGEDVFFLTGTDEHGLKTLRVAEELNKNPEEFADEISKKFKELKQIINLSNNDFIRTTDKIRHWPSVKKIWEKLEKNGDIYKKKYKGLYCAGCEAFVTQKDLVDSKCSIHLKEPELIEEENYFFKLSKYIPEIKKIINKNEIKIIPESKKNEILSMIEQGMEDVSFSREKEKYWGFFVPNDENQIIYVWPDALSNYISAIGYAENNQSFKKYWPADVHCIGKDIVKFHALYWPAMLLSIGIGLPKTILIHGFINVDGQKMSKSLGNIVDPFELVEKYGTDAVRYYLLREISPTEDGDFTYEKFEARYNSDLADGIGNLLSRTLAMAIKFNVHESVLDKSDRFSEPLKEFIKITSEEYKKYLDSFKFNEALMEIWKLISFCDKYINNAKPWEGKENARATISNSLYALKNIAEFLQCFLPETAEKINKAIKDKKSEILFPRV